MTNRYIYMTACVGIDDLTDTSTMDSYVAVIRKCDACDGDKEGDLYFIDWPHDFSEEDHELVLDWYKSQPKEIYNNEQEVLLRIKVETGHSVGSASFNKEKNLWEVVEHD